MTEEKTEAVDVAESGKAEEQRKTSPSLAISSVTESQPGQNTVSITSATQSGTTVTSSSAPATTSLPSIDSKFPSPAYATLSKPPPLISVSSLGTTDSIPKAQATVKLKAEPVSPGKEGSMDSLSQAVTAEEKATTLNPKSSSKQADSESSKLEPAKNLVSSPASTGGLGAGKPKAFLAMMNSAVSTPKKQTKRPAVGGGGSGGRGQGSKSKSSPLSSSSKKQVVDVVPSRSSNRNIKRPRTYEEEMDEMKATARTSVKKAKTTSRVRTYT